MNHKQLRDFVLKKQDIGWAYEHLMYYCTKKQRNYNKETMQITRIPQQRDVHSDMQLISSPL